MSGRSGGLVVQSFLILSIFQGSIQIWIPIKCQRVGEQEEVGAKYPGPALAESSIWGGESIPVDLDLKKSAEE